MLFARHFLITSIYIYISAGHKDDYCLEKLLYNPYIKVTRGRFGGQIDALSGDPGYYDLRNESNIFVCINGPAYLLEPRISMDGYLYEFGFLSMRVHSCELYNREYSTTIANKTIVRKHKKILAVYLLGQPDDYRKSYAKIIQVQTYNRGTRKIANGYSVFVIGSRICTLKRNSELVTLYIRKASFPTICHRIYGGLYSRKVDENLLSDSSNITLLDCGMPKYYENHVEVMDCAGIPSLKEKCRVYLPPLPCSIDMPCTTVTRRRVCVKGFCKMAFGRGEACPIGNECAEGLKCLSWICQSLPVPEGGVCTEEDICDEEGLVCKNGVCKMLTPEGAPCIYSDTCEESLTCKKGVCQKPLPCSFDMPCSEDDNVCVKGFCQKASKRGEACPIGNECAEGLMCLPKWMDVWTCQPLPMAEGGACTKKDKCEEGLVCKKNVCIRLSKEGGFCTGVDTCEKELECKNGVCGMPVIHSLGSCSVKEDCKKDLSCIEGTCVKCIKLGNECVKDGDCCSQSCTNKMCGCKTSFRRRRCVIG